MGTQKIEIAGIKIIYEMRGDFSFQPLNDFVNNFEGKADIIVFVEECDNIPHMPIEPFLKKETIWYFIDSGYMIDLLNSVSSSTVVRMKVNRDWNHAEILYVKDYDDASYNIENWFLEIIFRNRIIFNSGLVIHGSAILVDDNVIMFSAPSGTGKSTQAALWVNKKGAGHINDDHPAAIIHDGKVMVYGTPWAGSDQKYTNIFAPLQAVVILEQSKSNSIKRLNVHQIVQEFLPRCFLPFYDKVQMEKAMNIFEDITSIVPIYKLYCRPDKTAVKLLAETLMKGLK